MSEAFITVKNTDLTELRGREAPEGIYTSAELALGAMHEGAYRPGQGVGIREVQLSQWLRTESSWEAGIRTVFGSYKDGANRNCYGLIPEQDSEKMTPVQRVRFLQLEREHGVDTAADAIAQWKQRRAEARLKLTTLTDTDKPPVYFVTTPFTDSIGDYRFPSARILGAYTTREQAEMALEDEDSAEVRNIHRRHFNTRFDPRTFTTEDALNYKPVPVELDSRDELQQLINQFGLGA